MNYNSIINSGEVGNIGLKQLREQRELVTSKWEKFGLLEGLDGHTKENVAQLFENQATYMINESTTSDSSGAFETVAFPVIRRIFAKLLANEIVSVQALNMPLGRVYFIDPKISTRQADGSHYPMDGAYSNAADNYSLTADGRRISKTGGTQFDTSISLYDQFYATSYGDYGTALFDRTSGRIFVRTSLASGTTYSAGVTKYYTCYLTGFSTTSAGKLVGPIGAPMDTEEFLASLVVTASTNLTATGSTASVDTIVSGQPIPYRLPAQEYSKAIVDSTGKLKIELDLTYPGASDGSYIALSGTTGTSFGVTYSVYSDMEDDSEMAEVSFDFNYVTVDVGQPKKLRATFTPEVAQDASAFHSINVEAELTALLSETVSSEIDRVILRDLRNGAAWLTRWDYNGYKKQGLTGITRKDYNQTLVTVINQISAQINKATLRGGANWIVVSAEVGAVFNDLEYFHVSDASPEETKYSLGIEKIGSIQGRYSVYQDVYAPANTILIGHKGDSLFHSGFIYCPYVPLMIFPKMQNYTNATNVYITMSRYATKMINNRFYGKIYVDGLPTFGIGELR